MAAKRPGGLQANQVPVALDITIVPRRLLARRAQRAESWTIEINGRQVPQAVEAGDIKITDEYGREFGMPADEFNDEFERV